MNTNKTPELGTTVVGAALPCETPEMNMGGATSTTPPVSCNNTEEGNVTAHRHDTAAAVDVTSETAIEPANNGAVPSMGDKVLSDHKGPPGCLSSANKPIEIQSTTLSSEMLDWLSVNIENYEKIVLHGLINDRKLRETIMRVGLTNEDFSTTEFALIMGAFGMAAMMEKVYGIEIPVPATSAFFESHIAAAALDQEVGDEEINLSKLLIDELQSQDFSSMHGVIIPCLYVWFGSKRAKAAARQFMRIKVPDVRTILENLQADLDAASGLSFNLEDRKFDYNQQLVPPKSIIELAGHTIGTPGNLVTIQGPVKSAKSTVLEGIMAAALKYPCFTCDTLGISVAQPDGLALLHFDTEQSKHDHHRLLRRSYKRAKCQDVAGWLHSYHLTGMDPAACWNMLTLAVKSAMKAHGGVMMILIDGIADFCKYPNDAGECFELVRKLHKLAVDHECVIVTVIHENPGNGGGKTRGHLGSQLDRKAETSLRLQKDTKTGVVEMWVERGRSCFIPKSAGIRFQWCSENRMHLSLHASDGYAADSQPQKNDKVTRYKKEVEMVFADTQELSWTELAAKIMTVGGLAKPTAKSRIPEYLAHQLIDKDDEGIYRAVRPQPTP